MKALKRKSAVLFLLIGVILFLASHSLFSQPERIHDRSMIKPSLIYLNPGEKQQFKIVILATRFRAAKNPDAVTWSVNDIEGGNRELGTINEKGVYQAPSIPPKPCTVNICGYAKEVQNSYLFATVIIGESPPKYKSLRVWTEKVGDPNTRLKSPHGIGLDKKGNIIIADQDASRVFRYTAKGEFLDEIGEGPGSEPGQFNTPREVRSNQEGNIFVTDSKGDRPRIQVFNQKGEFLCIFAEKGRGPGQILRGHGIGFGPGQRLFIADVDNMRVNVYDNSGEFLYDFGAGLAYENMNPGEMNAPHGIFVDRSGDVFVNSYYGPTQKFSPEGAVLYSFAHGDPPDGPMYFHSIAGDKWGNVYLLVRGGEGYQGEIESGKGKKISIMKYNNSGDFITSWSFSDSRHSETTAVVDDNGLVYALFAGQEEMGVEIFIEE
jgi:hypothetical protein